MSWLAYIEWRSSGDVVVKLLACGAIRSGVWFLISPRRFQRLVISCFQLAILPKYRYFKAAQTKQPTNVEWNMNILVNTIAWSSKANDNRFSALCKHYLILPHISRQRSIILKKMQRVKYKSSEASSKRSFKIYDRPVAFYFQITNDKKFI